MTPRELADILKKEMQAQGIEFRVCAYCGGDYPLTKDWFDETVCSERCFSAYVSYLNNPQIW